jgi:nitrogen-specific signal transduction histidine kinase
MSPSLSAIYQPLMSGENAGRSFPSGPEAVALRHALNNPLTAILAEAQLLQLEALDAEHQEAVARIVEQCRRMVAITKQLQDDP